MHEPTRPEEPLRKIAEIGDWRVDFETGEMTRPGESTRLEPRWTEVLNCLARQAGRLVSKDDLIHEVWQGSSVSDDALWRCIRGLRRALGDDPRRPRYLETLPKRGYRLIAEVNLREAGGASPRARNAATTRHEDEDGERGERTKGRTFLGGWLLSSLLAPA